MSETMADELGSLRWSTIPLPPTAGARDEWHAATTLGPLELPVMRPGQLWLVELPATAPEVAPLEYRALSNANVVIYDRALASTVARYLPLGGYAEPAPEDGWSDAVLGRCLRFVRDGWSVTRLVDFPIAPVLQRTETLRHLSERLPGSAVLLFTNTGAGAYENSGSTLAELGATVDAAGRRGPLTLIFEAMVAEAAPRFSVALANGLAG